MATAKLGYARNPAGPGRVPRVSALRETRISADARRGLFDSDRVEWWNKYAKNCASLTDNWVKGTVSAAAVTSGNFDYYLYGYGASKTVRGISTCFLE